VIKILTCFRGRIVNLGISEAQLAVVRLNLWPFRPELIRWFL
jgi:hypothetical protein